MDLLDELESAHDAAHVSGRAKELERGIRAGLGDDPEYRAGRWAERAERCRNTAVRMGRICHWLRRHPEVPAIRDTELGCTFTLDVARAELRLLVEQHAQARIQEAFWRAEAEKDRAALALPAPANDAAGTVGKVA